jgi:hypothetical protein
MHAKAKELFPKFQNFVPRLGVRPQGRRITMHIDDLLHQQLHLWTQSACIGRALFSCASSHLHNLIG